MKYIEVVTTYKVVGYSEFQVPDSFDENNPLLTTPARIEEGAL